MPSKSPPQARLMAACSHGATYPSCPPVSVAHEFNQADKGTGIMSKGTGPKDASYAEGGAVLGRSTDFMKTPDRFRDNKGRTDNFGKGDGKDGAPAAKGKSLSPVAPRS